MGTCQSGENLNLRNERVKTQLHRFWFETVSIKFVLKRREKRCLNTCDEFEQDNTHQEVMNRSGELVVGRGSNELPYRSSINIKTEKMDELAPCHTGDQKKNGRTQKNHFKPHGKKMVNRNNDCAQKPNTQVHLTYHWSVWRGKSRGGKRSRQGVRRRSGWLGKEEPPLTYRWEYPL